MSFIQCCIPQSELVFFALSIYNSYVPFNSSIYLSSYLLPAIYICENIAELAFSAFEPWTAEVMKALKCRTLGADMHAAD